MYQIEFDDEIELEVPNSFPKKDIEEQDKDEVCEGEEENNDYDDLIDEDDDEIDFISKQFQLMQASEERARKLAEKRDRAYYFSDKRAPGGRNAQVLSVLALIDVVDYGNETVPGFFPFCHKYTSFIFSRNMRYEGKLVNISFPVYPASFRGIPAVIFNIEIGNRRISFLWDDECVKQLQGKYDTMYLVKRSGIYYDLLSVMGQERIVNGEMTILRITEYSDDFRDNKAFLLQNAVVVASVMTSGPLFGDVLEEGEEYLSPTSQIIKPTGEDKVVLNITETNCVISREENDIGFGLGAGEYENKTNAGLFHYLLRYGTECPKRDRNKVIVEDIFQSTPMKNPTVFEHENLRYFYGDDKVLKSSEMDDDTVRYWDEVESRRIHIPYQFITSVSMGRVVGYQKKGRVSTTDRRPSVREFLGSCLTLIPVHNRQGVVINRWTDDAKNRFFQFCSQLFPYHFYAYKKFLICFDVFSKAKIRRRYVVRVCKRQGYTECDFNAIGHTDGDEKLMAYYFL